ncbi:MAG: phasin family protein [Gammaproteobacteria bacterium SHHR-1]|uniref:phasin family protein n=1 Tax=Magnetovirga frankeli TaxID=947516 RepID=UPI0012939553|nr:phasin family protein [gamma proteobacterium SS-5]
MKTAKENLDMISDLNSKGYDNLRQLGELNLTTWNRMMETQLSTYSQLMESAINQTKAVTEAKTYQDALRTQLEMGRNLGETLIGKTREMAEMSQQVGAEYRSWFEKNLAAGKEEFDKAAAKAA